MDKEAQEQPDKYEVFFDGNKTEIEADDIVDICTQVSFYRGEERVAHFLVPFGTAFGYHKKANSDETSVS